MSAIMRRRRSLVGWPRIEGSCPEVGVLELPILRTGRPRRHPLSISWLARSLPLAPLPRERVRSLPLCRRSRGEARVTDAELTFLRKDLPRVAPETDDKCFVIARHLDLDSRSYHCGVV